MEMQQKAAMRDKISTLLKNISDLQHGRVMYFHYFYNVNSHVGAKNLISFIYPFTLHF